MASIRRGYSDDFTLNNNPSGFRKAASSSVGIGTSVGQEALDVVDGSVKGQDLKVTGVSSFTAYEGFLRANHQIAENTTLSFDQGPVSSLSGEIIVGTGVTVTIASVGLGTTVVGVGTLTTVNDVTTTDFTRAGGSEIECLKVFNTFTPPSGGTNERPYAPKPGELYYNYDFKTIEFFDGYGWRQVDNTTRSGRGVFGGGQSPTFVSLIDYVNVNTLGNAVSFGDMVASSGNNVRSGCAPVSSSTRGIFLGGGSPTRRSDCDYITIASEGNGIDFGNLTETAGFGPGASSSTRGLRFGGATPTVVSTIDYVQIPTTGDAIDFGELTQTVSVSGAASSPTRAVRAGGSSTTPTSKIDTVTIASTGNATDFGELSQARQGALGNVNSSTRGIFGGGRYSNPANHGTNTIDYITLSSIGNAIDFGDLTTERQGVGGACTQIRGVFAGGADYTPSASEENVIDFIMIASTGNGQDFGDLTVARQFHAGISDSHGGLGGF